MPASNSCNAGTSVSGTYAPPKAPKRPRRSPATSAVTGQLRKGRPRSANVAPHQLGVLASRGRLQTAGRVDALRLHRDDGVAHVVRTEPSREDDPAVSGDLGCHR